jgi:hypothetical protein
MSRSGDACRIGPGLCVGNFREQPQSEFRCLGSALVSGWCQIGSSAPAVFEKPLQKWALQIRHTL